MQSPVLPWPAPRNDTQIHLHNARVAISQAEDELKNFAGSAWLDDVYDSLALANDIL